MRIFVETPGGLRTMAFDDAMLRAGITVGSAPDCTLVVPGLPAVGAILFGWTTRVVARLAPATRDVPRTPTAQDVYVDRDQAVAVGGYRMWVGSVGTEGPDRPVRVRVYRDGRVRVLAIGGARDLREGIAIGADPSCALVLPDLPPRAGVLRAMGHHRMLDGRRVDGAEFELGPYTLQLVD